MIIFQRNFLGRFRFGKLVVQLLNPNLGFLLDIAKNKKKPQLKKPSKPKKGKKGRLPKKGFVFSVLFELPLLGLQSSFCHTHCDGIRGPHFFYCFLKHGRIKNVRKRIADFRLDFQTFPIVFGKAGNF